MSAQQGSSKSAARDALDRKMDEKAVRDFNDPDIRKKRRKNVRAGFCITLAIMLVVSVINWGVITGWGNVDIDRVTISGNDGAEFSALVYRPANATDDTPAPAAVIYHGWSGNARCNESWAMELARRGYVVVSPDLNASGDSEGYYDGTPNSNPGAIGTHAAKGVLDEAEAFYRYAMNTSFIDADNIITVGHSSGCLPAILVGARYDAQGIIVFSSAQSAIDMVDPAEGVKAGYSPEGMDPAYKEAWAEWDGTNIFVGFGASEAGSDQQAHANKQGLALLNKISSHANETNVEIGKEYGSYENGDGFVFTYETRNHEGAFVSSETANDLLTYAQKMVDAPTPIDGSDQVWQLKDFTGLAGIVSFVAFLMATTLLLMEEVPAFGKIRRPLARNVGFRGAGLIIASVIGFIAPYVVIKTGAFGLNTDKTSSLLTTMGFNLGFSNMAFAVIVGLSIICLLGLVLYVLGQRKKGLSLDDFALTAYAPEGASASKARGIISMILRSLLLTAIVIAIGWGFLQLQDNVAGTDFFAWYFGVKDIPISKIWWYWPYVIVFILCFVLISIDMNVIRRLPSTGNETKDMLLAMLVNLIVGATVITIIVAVKWHLQSTGDPAYSNWFWSMLLDDSRLYGLPLGVGVATICSTFIYRKTGNIWLCGILVGTIACLMCLLYGQTGFHYLTYSAPLA